MQPPPLNEKVLKDKRKKLKETLDRVLKMYVSILKIAALHFKIYNFKFVLCVTKTILTVYFQCSRSYFIIFSFLYRIFIQFLSTRENYCRKLNFLG